MLYQKIKNDTEVLALLERGNFNLGVLGFTDHSTAHTALVADRAANILQRLGYDEQTQQLARIAGFMHDIGNAVNRSRHGEYGAILAYDILKKYDMPLADRMIVVSAIGNHDESTGGAKDLCDTGIFGQYNVEAIFGLHLWPGLEKGRVFSRRNELMARASEVNVDIYGKSAHIARSWEGIDSMEAACVFLQKAYALERSVPADIRRLLKFGHMQSGTVRNALSAHARMEGGLRAFSDEVFFGLRDRLLEIAKEVETSFGCEVRVHTSNGYPAIHNPRELHDKVHAIAPFEYLEEPSMTTEDFSWYQRFVPGMFFFLGLGDTPALHSDNFDFDESVLNIGADFFEKIAEGWT